MKKILTGSCIIILASLSLKGVPADSTDMQAARTALRCRETVRVFTDRELYAAGEAIRFAALVQSRAHPENAPPGSVIYAELVDPTGEAWSRAKFRLEDMRSSGSLTIPPSLAPGRYYLRCYTRWMRNFGPAAYSYTPLRVVNARQASTGPGSPPGLQDSLRPEIPVRVAVNLTRKSSVYGKGEEIGLQCTLPLMQEKAVLACLTAVPLGSIDTLGLLHSLPSVDGQAAPGRLSYLPDLGAQTLSGRVTISGTNDPLPGIQVLFTTLGSDPVSYVAITGRQGRYDLRIPDSPRKRELSVVPVAPAGQVPEVQIDQDYSTDPLPFHSPPFELDALERTVAGRISLNRQLEELYGPGSPGSSPVENPGIPPFYGPPDLEVDLDEFIDLPNMEEVIHNLIPDTYVREKKDRRLLRIAGENPMMETYDPLFLVDHIPWPDAESLLEVDPAVVSRISLLRRVLVLGEARYGGVMSLHTRDGRPGSTGLPPGSYFFDFDTLQAPARLTGPPALPPGKIPDFRNTLYWSDRAEPGDDGIFRTSFTAPGQAGTYLILYRAISGDGALLSGQAVFFVKEAIQN